MDPQTLALQAVGGFTIGAVIGYAARKLAKVLLLAIGVMLLPLVLLWQAGVLYVNWSALNEVIGRVVMWVAGSVKSLEDALASAGVFGASALIGFFFGVASPALHSAAYKPSEQYRFVKRKVWESERGSKQA